MPCFQGMAFQQEAPPCDSWHSSCFLVIRRSGQMSKTCVQVSCFSNMYVNTPWLCNEPGFMCCQFGSFCSGWLAPAQVLRVMGHEGSRGGILLALHMLQLADTCIGRSVYEGRSVQQSKVSAFQAKVARRVFRNRICPRQRALLLEGPRCIRPRYGAIGRGCKGGPTHHNTLAQISCDDSVLISLQTPTLPTPVAQDTD